MGGFRISLELALIDELRNVVWAGDFNYRVGLANEEVRDAIARNDISAALDADQLEASRSAYLVFNGYTEGPITFAPTYKYDNGTDRTFKTVSLFNFLLIGHS